MRALATMAAGVAATAAALCPMVARAEPAPLWGAPTSPSASASALPGAASPTPATTLSVASPSPSSTAFSPDPLPAPGTPTPTPAPTPTAAPVEPPPVTGMPLPTATLPTVDPAPTSLPTSTDATQAECLAGGGVWLSVDNVGATCVVGGGTANQVLEAAGWQVFYTRDGAQVVCKIQKLGDSADCKTGVGRDPAAVTVRLWHAYPCSTFPDGYTDGGVEVGCGYWSLARTPSALYRPPAGSLEAWLVGTAAQAPTLAVPNNPQGPTRVPPPGSVVVPPTPTPPPPGTPGTSEPTPTVIPTLPRVPGTSSPVAPGPTTPGQPSHGTAPTVGQAPLRPVADRSRPGALRTPGSSSSTAPLTTAPAAGGSSAPEVAPSAAPTIVAPRGTSTWTPPPSRSPEVGPPVATGEGRAPSPLAPILALAAVALSALAGLGWWLAKAGPR